MIVCTVMNTYIIIAVTIHKVKFLAALLYSILALC